MRKTRKKKPHWTKKFLLAGYVFAILWTTVAHALTDRAAGMPKPSLQAIPKEIAALPGRVFKQVPKQAPKQANVQTYVQTAAKGAGVDPSVAEWIVSHESGHRPSVTGDGGTSRGLWQINKDWHPEVTDACAYDMKCSTDWSLGRIRLGYSNEWSTWKYCREKFDDCPF
jgi:hypothetical protein